MLGSLADLPPPRSTPTGGQRSTTSGTRMRGPSGCPRQVRTGYPPTHAGRRPAAEAFHTAWLSRGLPRTGRTGTHTWAHAHAPHTHSRAHTHTLTCACAHGCTHVHVHIHTYTHSRVQRTFTRTCTHAHTCTQTVTHAHTHTHVHTQCTHAHTHGCTRTDAPIHVCTHMCTLTQCSLTCTCTLTCALTHVHVHTHSRVVKQHHTSLGLAHPHSLPWAASAGAVVRDDGVWGRLQPCLARGPVPCTDPPCPTQATSLQAAQVSCHRYLSATSR